MPSTSEALSTIVAFDEKSAWWRTVLGEYPTGVTLITSVDEGGDPVGMIVGSFAAVSQDPPLVSFMPTSSSWTFAEIARSGRFMASVLGAEHEDFCRTFSAGAEGRCRTAEFDEGRGGLPRLRGALAWVEASISTIVPAGDHSIVLGEIRDLGVGDGAAGLPLIYLKGGYGSFTPPKAEFNTSELGGRLRMAELAGPLLDELARSVPGECALATLAQDSVVVIASAAGAAGNRPASVTGMCFPFAAPLSPVLVAWSDPARAKAWTESARHLLGRVDRPLLNSLVDQVRERGYSVSLGDTMRGAFDDVVADAATDRAALGRLWSVVQKEYAATHAGDEWWRDVSAIHIPVFGADRQASMELVIGSLTPFKDRQEFERAVRLGLRAGEALTTAVGGADPRPLEP